MFQKILVPLDGSPRAEQAIPVAARLAHAAGGMLVLLEVANPYTDYAPYIAVPVPPDTSREDALAYLRDITQRPEVQGLPAITEVLTGSVAEAVLSAAREHR